MNRSLLNAGILLSGILLGVLHYQLKPTPSDRQVRDEAQGMSARVEWQGHIAPDFEITTTRGEHFRLSDNIGKKIILLNFFATWCVPCREEMPELNRYFNQHRGDSFLIVGIDAEENRDRVAAFLQELKVDFSAGVDPGPIRQLYGVDSYPTSVLIGVDGKVQFYESGALVNAEVAFDNLLKVNEELIRSGKVVSRENYQMEAQAGLKVQQSHTGSSAEEEYKLDERGKRIVSNMVCPCGCDDKVKACTCSTSKKIKKALASEDFKNKPDEQIMRELNKRFCVGGM